MAASNKVRQTTAVELGSLLDAGEGAVVTLVAGETCLVAHKAVLSARSPVFEAMFQHDTVEASSGRVSIPDVEGQVLRQLLVYMYTLQLPQLAGMALQMLVAADKYGLLALKTHCEKQVVAQLSVETAAAAAVLSVRLSCTSLRNAAIAFIRAHSAVMATQGWADLVRSQPEDVIEVSRLLAETTAETRSVSAEEKGRRLIEAAKEGRVGEVEALLPVTADVGATDGDSNTALHWAADRGHVEVARQLLQRGAKVDASNSVHRTPLHWAAASGHAAVVRLLAAASAYPDATDNCGLTPLHRAAVNGHVEVVAALLKAGADREVTDNKERTPLDLAMQCYMPHMMQLLSFENTHADLL